jgi:VanZ family protein
MIIYLLSGVIAIILLVSHLFGMDGLYYAYDWYDIPMHIVGGITLGLLAYQLSHSLKDVSHFSWRKIILAIILIGLAWEIFESMFGIAGAPVGTYEYYFDTIKDLINDTLGAFIGMGIATLIHKHIYKNVISN